MRDGRENEPDNIDRRKGFLDILERLGQGVMATGPADPVRNRAGDEVDPEPPPAALRSKSKLSE
jgi:hypothetical protein